MIRPKTIEITKEQRIVDDKPQDAKYTIRIIEEGLSRGYSRSDYIYDMSLEDMKKLAEAIQEKIK